MSPALETKTNSNRDPSQLVALEFVVRRYLIDGSRLQAPCLLIHMLTIMGAEIVVRVGERWRFSYRLHRQRAALVLPR